MALTNPDDTKFVSTPGPVAGDSPLRGIIAKAKPPIIGNAGQLVVASLRDSVKEDPDVFKSPYEYFRGTLVGEAGPYVVIETSSGPKTLPRSEYDFFVQVT